jgi:hypothetical protein
MKLDLTQPTISSSLGLDVEEAERYLTSILSKRMRLAELLNLVISDETISLPLKYYAIFCIGQYIGKKHSGH